MFTPATGAEKLLNLPDATATGPDEGVHRIPALEETLDVEKQVVDRGGVRVTKRVETREQLVDLLLRSEHVEIERRPVNAAIADGAVPVMRQEGDTLIVPVIEKLQEVEEALQVGKRAVAKGGVRIFTRMTEVPVTETVRLREEHADVKRTAVNRPATGADFAAFKEGSIEVREMSEEAVVSKTARVTGEVEVGKTATEREETIHETVRKTKVDVGQLEGTVSGTGSRTTAFVDDASHGSANRDPITGTPGAHPVGTGVGAVAGGMAAGAAAGTVAGPVGTVVGAAVGAVAGGFAGNGVAEKIDPTTTGKTRV